METTIISELKVQGLGLELPRGSKYPRIRYLGLG